jgi:plasmid stabilization system protein ParE
MSNIKRVRFAKEARADLEDIAAYIAKHNVQASAEIVIAVIQTTELLALFPGMGRRSEGTARIFVVPRTPFIIAYEEFETAIDIVAVFHGAQNKR